MKFGGKIKLYKYISLRYSNFKLYYLIFSYKDNISYIGEKKWIWSYQKDSKKWITNYKWNENKYINKHVWIIIN